MVSYNVWSEPELYTDFSTEKWPSVVVKRSLSDQSKKVTKPIWHWHFPVSNDIPRSCHGKRCVHNFLFSKYCLHQTYFWLTGFRSALILYKQWFLFACCLSFSVCLYLLSIEVTVLLAHTVYWASSAHTRQEMETNGTLQTLWYRQYMPYCLLPILNHSALKSVTQRFRSGGSRTDHSWSAASSHSDTPPLEFRATGCNHPEASCMGRSALGSLLQPSWYLGKQLIHALCRKSLHKGY